MNLGELFRTKRWKTFMGYIYGWGASVVMIGALFKLQHWQYSGLLLTVGLMTEAFIFFLSAFEPSLEMPEWSKVYPELREDYELVDNDELDQGRKKGLDQIFSGSNLTPDLLNKVGDGLKDLTSAARGISDISAATLATDIYVKNLSSASETMNTFAEINSKANESINNSVGKLIDSYTTASQQLTETGQTAIEKLNKGGDEFTSKLNETGLRMAKAFDEVASSMSSEMKTISESSVQYSGSLGRLNKNMVALNESFEAQLKGTKQQFEASQKFNNDLSQMNEMLSASVSELKKYKENAEQLNKNLESLNTIYGNMLGAMSYKK